MEVDQVPENDLTCSIKDDVIYLVRHWKSISKDRLQCSKEKLISINKLEKITTNFEGSTSAYEENLKPLLNIMVCFALLFISLAIYSSKSFYGLMFIQIHAHILQFTRFIVRSQ